jgi:cobalt-zinc-cadmium efflux system outer membrane protein
VLTAKVSVAQAKNDLIANERALLTTHATLNHLLGRSAGEPIELSEKLETPPPLPALLAVESLAIASRPEIQSLEAQRQAARASTKLASRFWLPDLSLTISRNLTVGSPPAYSTILAFDVPVFFWQHTNGDVAQARSKEEELAANAAEARLQVEVDVRSSYAAAETAVRQVQFLEQELLPEAQEQYRIASESYSLGGSSAVDVLQARQALVTAQHQLTDALGAASDALADLERAAGAPLPPAARTPPQGDSHEN